MYFLLITDMLIIDNLRFKHLCFTICSWDGFIRFWVAL